MYRERERESIKYLIYTIEKIMRICTHIHIIYIHLCTYTNKGVGGRRGTHPWGAASATAGGLRKMCATGRVFTTLHVPTRISGSLR